MIYFRLNILLKIRRAWNKYFLMQKHLQLFLELVKHPHPHQASVQVREFLMGHGQMGLFERQSWNPFVAS